MSARSPIPKVVSELVRQFQRALRERYGDSLLVVRLFGSYASGRATEDSDVDVFVVLESVDWPTKRAIIDLATDLGLERDLLLSPTVFDRATYERWRRQERPLIIDIERDGVAL